MEGRLDSHGSAQHLAELANVDDVRAGRIDGFQPFPRIAQRGLAENGRHILDVDGIDAWASPAIQRDALSFAQLLHQAGNQAAPLSRPVGEEESYDQHGHRVARLTSETFAA